jgi:hypothetical protein
MDLLDRPLFAHLATSREDGWPQVKPDAVRLGTPTIPFRRAFLAKSRYVLDELFDLSKRPVAPRGPARY